MHHARPAATCAAFVISVSVVFAQPKPAALLLEAAAINHERIEPPSNNIVTSPGDVITAHLYVQAWSPSGEVIRAYQATIPQTTYTTGTSGSIKPVNFEAALAAEAENPANAFIDINRPDFAFHGLQTVAIVDTISFDYRWLGVIVDNAKAFPCPDPDRKYYAGTLRLEVSADAAGEFTIGFVEAQWASVISDVDNLAIAPMEYGKLSIRVSADVPPRITGSVPPYDAVVAARPSHGRAASIDVYFNVDVPDIQVTDFVISDGGDGPLKVTKVVPNGKSATLTLDRPLRPKAWTLITHAPSGTQTRIGCLPGDVDGNGRLTSADVTSLIFALAQTTNPLAMHQADLNGDGSVDVSDALELIEILNSPKVYRDVLE